MKHMQCSIYRLLIMSLKKVKQFFQVLFLLCKNFRTTVHVKNKQVFDVNIVDSGKTLHLRLDRFKLFADLSLLRINVAENFVCIFIKGCDDLIL